MTRPQLGAALAFSKPTMSAAVAELEGLGLLAPKGMARAAAGRNAVSYGLGPDAGLVIGVDCGTTQIHAVAARLDGDRLAHVRYDLDAEAIIDAAKRYVAIDTVLETLLKDAQAKRADVRAIAIALPNTVSPDLDHITDRDAFTNMLTRMHKAYRAPILAENNVNCAALAEYHDGVAKNRSSAVYMQIGVKVGIGIVVDGMMFRGFRGGAGEIAHLPFPWSASESPKPSEVEMYLGSAQWLERSRADWPSQEGAPPRSTAELFERAEHSAHARHCVNLHATAIGNLAAACASILDPELIVLGGGVGLHEILAERVREVIARLHWPVAVEISALGGLATVFGASRLAINFAMAGLLNEERKAAFVYPTTLPHRAMAR